MSNKNRIKTMCNNCKNEYSLDYYEIEVDSDEYAYCLKKGKALYQSKPVKRCKFKQNKEERNIQNA